MISANYFDLSQGIVNFNEDNFGKRFVDKLKI
jgi:hypothetical protein